jgi:hypothetical protein
LPLHVNVTRVSSVRVKPTSHPTSSFFLEFNKEKLQILMNSNIPSVSGKKVPIAQPVGDVPADAQLDDLGMEAATSVNGISDYRLGHLGISWTPELYDNAP